MNRGIFIIGIVAIVLTVANIFASVIFVALVCFDSCPSVVSFVAGAPLSALVMALVLGPAISLILVGWIWEIIELRRMGRRGWLIFTALMPVIALVAVVAIAMLSAVTGGKAPLDFTPFDLWTGNFALTLWPLAVAIVGFRFRQRASVPPTPSLGSVA